MSIFHREPSDRYVIQIVDDGKKKRAPKVSPKIQKVVRVAKRVGVLTRKIVVSLMVAMLAFLGFIGTAIPAHADPISDGLESMFCSTPIAQHEISGTMLQATTDDKLDAATHKLTGYEYFNMAGMKQLVWKGAENQTELDGDGKIAGRELVRMAGGKDSGIGTWADNDSSETSKAHRGFFNTKESCQLVSEYGATTVANSLLGMSTFITYIDNSLYQFTVEASTNITKQFSGIITDVIVTLRDALYLEFYTLIVMFGALWMAWVGLVKKQSVQAAQGAIWMVSATVASMFLLGSPTLLIDFSQKITGATTSALTSQLADSGIKIGGQDSNICSVGTGSGDATQDGIRVQQCIMWYSFAYVPWVQGQYGMLPSQDSDTIQNGAGSYQGGTHGIGPDLVTPPKVVLGNEALVPQTWASTQLDSRTQFRGWQQSDEDWQDRVLLHVAANQLYKDNGEYNKDWRGENSGNRIVISLVALMSSIAVFVLIAIVCISIIILCFQFVLLVLLAPLFCLIGVHPGFGRRIATRWLNSMATNVIRQIVLNLYLGLLIKVIAIAMTNASSGGDAFARMFVLIGLTGAAIAFKDNLLKMFDVIKIGDGQQIFQNGSLDKKFEGAGAGLAGALGMNAISKLTGAGRGRGASQKDSKVNGSKVNGSKEQDLTPKRIKNQPNKVADSSTESDAKDSGTKESRKTYRDDSAGAGDAPNRDDRNDDVNGDSSGAGEEPKQSKDTSADSKKSEVPEPEQEQEQEQEQDEATKVRRRRNPAATPSAVSAGVAGMARGWNAGGVGGGLMAGVSAAQAEADRAAREDESQWIMEQRVKENDKSQALPPIKPKPKDKPEPPKADPSPKEAIKQMKKTGTQKPSTSFPEAPKVSPRHRAERPPRKVPFPTLKNSAAS